jgi:hypothetical protein
VDPEFSLDDFNGGTPGELSDAGSLRFSPATLEERRRLGILQATPDPWLLLDPFYGLEFDGEGEVQGGEVRGVLIITDPTQDLSHTLLHHREPKGEGVVLLEAQGQSFDHVMWLDGGNFVAVGWTPVRHPRFAGGAWGTVRVPAVWIANRKEQTVHLFRGAPMPPTVEPELQKQLARFRHAAYPRLQLDGSR